MKKLDIVTMPYFCHEVIAWDSGLKINKLGKSNINNLFRRLEEGENIYNVIPNFSKVLKFQLRCAYFGTKREMHYSGEIFDSREHPIQVRKLLVPHYNVVNRNWLISEANKKHLHISDREFYERTLSENPDADMFYPGPLRLMPLNPEKVLILKEDQLS